MSVERKLRKLGVAQGICNPDHKKIYIFTFLSQNIFLIYLYK